MRRASYGLADEWPYLVGGSVAAVWRWRLELLLVLAPALTWQELADELGTVAASAIVASIIGLVLAPNGPRGALARWLKAARIRRRWRRAWVDVGLPRVVARQVSQVPAGELIRIRCSRGSSIPAVAAHAERLAACLGTSEVRVSRDPRHAAWGTALLVRRDPLDGVTAVWPWADAEGPLSLWQPLPVGVDEFGYTLPLLLPGTKPAPGWRARSGQERGAVTRAGSGRTRPHRQALAPRR